MGSPPILVLLCAAWFVGGCTHSEPTLVPLGHGPLSRAQRARESGKRALALKPPAESQLEERESALHSSASPASADASDGGVAADASVEPAPSSTADRGSGAANRDPLEDWIGLYRGNDTTVFKTPEQGDRRFDDPKAKIRVESMGSARLDLILIDSSNGVDMCRLAASVDSDQARIDPDQSCFLDPTEGMTAKSRPGKAQRQGRQLTVDLVFDTTMASETGSAEGTIEYHFDGQR